jgi:23S rRNA (cytosine1962-C5)-methyltransferase
MGLTPSRALAQVTLRLRVSAAAESALRSGHPWVYAQSIQDQNRKGKPGDLAVIYDRKDRFLAIGLFDPESSLRFRALHTGKPERLDREWWHRHLVRALERRQGIADEQTNAYRCLNGESDQWPGLVLDKYDSTLALKLYTEAWFPHLELIAALVEEHFRPKRIVLRLSRNIEEAAKRCGHFDGQILKGLPLTRPVAFLENNLVFEADVLRGQKTGFFLDQRENRRRVGALASGRSVLNLFSFSGAFSVYAARGGASSVVDVDISEHALASAQRNFRSNSSIAQVRGCRREAIQADVFEWLAQSAPRKFGCIILDPPSLAKRESERRGALQAYRALAQNALRRLAPQGVLVAASCSAHVSANEFFEGMRQAASQSGRKFTELDRTLHPPDHPAAFPEAQYLKCIYLRVT